ncbi:hypothetical protein Tco_0359207 [Tanacetum coccineum]
MPKTLQRFTTSREDRTKERLPRVQQKWSVPLNGTKGIKDTFTPLIRTSNEILAMKNVSFPESPPLIGTPEKQNLNKFCDYHGDRGHNTNNCYQLKKHIEEVVASGKLAHLVKDIRRNNLRNGSQGRKNVKIINMIRGGEYHKRPFEGERSGLVNELTFTAIPRNQLTDEPIVLEGVIEGHQTKKMQSSTDRILRRNVPAFGNNRLSSNYGKGRKEQNGANGVFNNKMSFAIQRHNRKDRNEKPQSGMQTARKGARFVEGGTGDEGMIRKVQHPEWVTNTIPIKLAKGTWKVQVDYSSLNKVCAKDMYPFSEEGEELASLMEYP